MALLRLLNSKRAAPQKVLSYFYRPRTSRCFSEAADAPAPATEAVQNEEEEEDKIYKMYQIKYKFTPPPPLSEESLAKIEKIHEKIIWLDFIELGLLTKIVMDRIGHGGMDAVMGGGAVPSAAGGAGDGVEAPAAEEKTLFEVKLVGFDAKAKIKVIKEIRAIAGLGLKEAKELVESAPKVIQKDLKADKAEELKAQLEAIGAQIEVV